jgi:hypothetical protein
MGDTLYIRIFGGLFYDCHYLILQPIASNARVVNNEFYGIWKEVVAA